MPQTPKPEHRELFQEPIPDTPTPNPIFNKIGVIENVDKETRNIIFKYYSKFQIYSFYSISLTWILFWAYTLFQKMLDNSVKTDLRGYVFLLVLPFIIAITIYANLRNKILKIFVQQFAKENGLSYITPSKGITDEAGSLFNVGHSKNITHLISGKFLGHDIQIFYYKYTVGQGKQSRTFYSTVLRITNDHELPPILLLVDADNFGGIKQNCENSVKLNSEADFEKKFDLYSKQKYEIEALQVFNPEFMNIMLKRWGIFNIDFSGKDIYIFTNSEIQIRIVLQNMFALGKYILENIDPRLVAMKGSIKALNELNPNNK